MSDLSWDYSPIRQVLVSFIHQRLLPGYVAAADSRAVAYTYFLVNQAKGTIGAVYASRAGYYPPVIEELVSLSVSSLRDSPSINRIEAQIIPFNDLNLTAAFARHGFSRYSRFYMELDLTRFRRMAEAPLSAFIVPWSPAYVSRAAEMTSLSYRNQADAVLSVDYRTRESCETYLRSLLESPGCGIFMPGASFAAMDEGGFLHGFIFSCRISEKAGMIPQIAVDPSSQGKGLGNALMSRALDSMKSTGMRTVSLTVTAENRRAFDWYERLGFRIRKEFGAYVWERR